MSLIYSSYSGLDEALSSCEHKLGFLGMLTQHHHSGAHTATALSGISN